MAKGKISKLGGKVARSKNKTAGSKRRLTPPTAANIGILHSGRGGRNTAQINVFLNALRRAGFHPTLLPNGRPLWSDDDPDTLQSNADTLANAPNIQLIIAAGGSASVYAAQRATGGNNRSVVFTTYSEQTSPAANMTGVCARTVELDPDRLTLLYAKMLTEAPGQKNFGVLENQKRRGYNGNALQTVATALKFSLDRHSVYMDPGEGDADVVTRINDAFAAWAVPTAIRPAIRAALVAADPIFNDHIPEIIAAGRANGIATMHQWSEFKNAGAYASYGTDISEAYAEAARIAAQVLQGTNPSAIPVYVLPNTYAAFDLQVARRLGLKC
jgi:ABC transporter substrate binding protein